MRRPKLDILSEYERLGRKVKEIEERRLAIRNEVKSRGGFLETPSYRAILVNKRRQQIAGFDIFEQAGFNRKWLDERHLIKTIEYQQLEILKVNGSKKAS